jgi:hypothetical protein
LIEGTEEKASLPSSGVLFHVQIRRKKYDKVVVSRTRQKLPNALI